MQTLMRFMDNMERWMAAAAFAQSGCWDMALDLMNEGKRRSRRPEQRARLGADQRPSLRI